MSCISFFFFYCELSKDGETKEAINVYFFYYAADEYFFPQIYIWGRYENKLFKYKTHKDTHDFRGSYISQ